jgi:hypothetical protein
LGGTRRASVAQIRMVGFVLTSFLLKFRYTFLAFSYVQINSRVTKNWISFLQHYCSSCAAKIPDFEVKIGKMQ